MEPNYSKIFNKKTMQTVSAFCELNKIDDIYKFIKKCFTDGFNIEKYGLLGETLNEGEKDLKTDEIGEKDLRDSRKTCGIEEKRAGIEVIQEKQAEKEAIQIVEVIKEVEKIVEVEVIKYVDKEIIKEVPVEKVVTKIEYISDKTGENELLGKIEQLENEMSKKDNELDELRRNLDIKLDENKLKMMGETLLKLRKELSLKDKKIEELEGINKQLENGKVSQNATYLNGSNIIRRL
jgi:hypothetical protein